MPILAESPKARRRGLSLAAVRDLREVRAGAGPEELVDFETDVLAGFVLARAAAGLSDGTISSDVIHVEQVRAWLGRPLWEMEPPDADAYFGKVLRGSAKGTRLARAQALKTYFLFLELRHKVEIHNLTGRVVECPIDHPGGVGIVGNLPSSFFDVRYVGEMVPRALAGDGAHRRQQLPALRLT